jgi:RimJ/RimL family protein N-acetyltransferase
MIYGERLRFRAAEQEDLPIFVEWLNDPEVRRGLDMFLPMSKVREEKWFEAMLERPEEAHVLIIEAKKRANWLMIGSCGLMNIDWKARNAEIGIMIGDKSYWNKGYGTEAMQLILRHGFETLNLHRLDLRVYEDNPRAIRAYEKAGFVHEGRLREGEYSEGHYMDVLLMSVLRTEWQQAQTNQE